MDSSVPKTIDADYPRYENVIPTNNNHLSIGLGVEVLEKLVKSIKKTGQSYIKLSFSDDDMKPIIGKCGDVEYIIMPYKLHE